MKSASCAIALLACLGWAAPARAGGVCVRIDTSRDSLAPDQQKAVRIAIERALEAEGIAVDHGVSQAGAPGDAATPCAAVLSAYAIQLGNTVTVTLVADHDVTGRAANLDEVDLLVSQLVRSLVTGRSLATGSGVTDRHNVLRAQAAPRRADATDGRRWDPVIAVGGGMLQLPPEGDRARQRQWDVVSIESRWWGFTGDSAAVEIYGRVLLHDYAAIGAADDAYDRAHDDPEHHAEGRRFTALIFSPFAVANYEGGLGIVGFAGSRPPRPFVRVGAAASLLLRFSDPDHYADVGLGGYVGVGLQLTSHVSVSVAANLSNPIVHDFFDDGYDYFLTTTALLEIRRQGSLRRGPRFLGQGPEPVPVIRVINDGPRD